MKCHKLKCRFTDSLAISKQKHLQKVGTYEKQNNKNDDDRNDHRNYDDR